MLQRATYPLLLLFSLVSCRREPDTEPTLPAESSSQVVVDEGCPHMVDGQCSHSPAADPTGHTAGTQLYGDPLGSSPVVPLGAILDSPDKYHDQTVRVSGHVSRACSRKGCWMELAQDTSEDADRCRVTFKDYGFFVPTNAAGSKANLEGVVQVTQVKKAAVQHYESEGATFKGKRGDGTAREVRLVATGVELSRI